MNEESQAELDRILAFEPEALTDGDKAFLAARRSYLSEDQQARYGLSEEAKKLRKLKSQTSN